MSTLIFNVFSDNPDGIKVNPLESGLAIKEPEDAIGTPNGLLAGSAVVISKSAVVPLVATLYDEPAAIAEPLVNTFMLVSLITLPTNAN
jgi:hypothetical protein